MLWLCVGRRGLAAARCCACAACRRAAFAGLALGARGGRPPARGHGLQPGDPGRTTPSSRSTGALRYLADRSPARFAGLGDVPQNVPALRLRLQDARGNDPPILERYNRLWRREVSPEYPGPDRHPHQPLPPGAARRRAAPAHAAAARRGAPARAAAGAGRRRRRGSTPRASTRGLQRARRPRAAGSTDALPRTFVAGAQQPSTASDAALDAVTSPWTRSRARWSSPSSRLPGVPEIAATAPGGHGADRLLRARPRDHRRAPRPGPAWSCSATTGTRAGRPKVDGRPVDVERVDYVLRGAVVGARPPPGRVPLRAGELADRLDHQPAVARRLAAGVLAGRRRRPA